MKNVSRYHHSGVWGHRETPNLPRSGASLQHITPPPPLHHLSNRLVSDWGTHPFRLWWSSELLFSCSFTGHVEPADSVSLVHLGCFVCSLACFFHWNVHLHRPTQTFNQMLWTRTGLYLHHRSIFDDPKHHRVPSKAASLLWQHYNKVSCKGPGGGVGAAVAPLFWYDTDPDIKQAELFEQEGAGGSLMHFHSASAYFLLMCLLRSSWSAS